MSQSREASQTRVAHRAIGALMALVGVTLGCPRPDYTQSIQRYERAHREATPVLVDLYSRLNAFERESYVMTSVCSGAQLAPTVRVEGVGSTTSVPTPLFQDTFSPDAIQARVDALEVLGLYADYLGALAGSDAPQRFATAGENFGTRVANLDRHFRPGLTKGPTSSNSSSGTSQDVQGVSQSGTPQPEDDDNTTSTDAGTSSTASSGTSASPLNVSAIFGAVFNLLGQAAVEGERDEKLRDGILRGREFVRLVLDVLEDDLTRVIGPTREDWYAQQLTACASYYNDRRAGMSLDQRRAMAERLLEIAEAREAFRTSSPADLVRAMRTAHDSLVRYAQNPEANRDAIARLASGMEDFARRVSNAVDAYRRIAGLGGVTSDTPSSSTSAGAGDGGVTSNTASSSGASSGGSTSGGASSRTTSTGTTSTTTRTTTTSTRTTGSTGATSSTGTTSTGTTPRTTTSSAADAGVSSRPAAN